MLRQWHNRAGSTSSPLALYKRFVQLEKIPLLKDFLNRLGAITDVTGYQPHPSVVLVGRLCAGSLGISSVDEAVSQSSAKENEQLWPRNRSWRDRKSVV